MFSERMSLARILASVCLGLALTACSSLRSDFVKRPSSAIAPAFDTPAARYVRSEVDAHPGLSGFRLLKDSTNALLSRITLADHAEHSIDLQYYIFQNDSTGRLVALHLLAAADRGARIRLLLDDINSSGEDHFIDALDAHPNIQVRLFNPFRTRSPSLPSKIVQFVAEGSRLNRRMHNKSFIVDNAAAVIGGRNIGDPYFNAGEDTHFRDLDLIAIGPVVAAASRTFDDYWNSDAAYPIKAFRGARATPSDLTHLRTALAHDARAFLDSDYAQAALEKPVAGATGDDSGAWFWGPAELVADQPDKIEADHDEPGLRIGPKLRTVIDSAQQQVLLISPYFVPGQGGTQYLVDLAKRGVNVNVLTNSLASNDEPAAHAGYAHYRPALLAGGVHLFELRPAPGNRQTATGRGKSAGVSLHAKAVVVDDRYAFVGSMNMDQRSKLLNTEMGVIVDCPELAQAVAAFFAKATRPGNSFRVALDEQNDKPARDGRLIWLVENDGQLQTLNDEPQATVLRKLEVNLLRLLPIEGLL